MSRFKDNKNRAWSIDVTVDTVKRVRSLCDVDLLGAVDGKLLEQFVTDPILLCDVIFAVCKPQADTEGVSSDDFGAGLAGDALDEATRALLEGLVDFFPKRRRELLAKVVAKMQLVEEKGMELWEAKLAAINPEALLQQLADSSPNYPAFSD